MKNVIILAVVFLTSCISMTDYEYLDRVHVQIAERNAKNVVRDIGSGSILTTEGDYTYILTAKHLFQEPTRQFYVKEDINSRYRELEIKALHPDFDAAIVAYNGSKQARKIHTQWTNAKVYKNDPIVFVGAPRGLHREIKIGNIEMICGKEIQCVSKGKTYVVDTPGNFGYSGGGAYRHGVLIGINTAVFVNMFRQPLKALFLSLEDLKGWVNSTVNE